MTRQLSKAGKAAAFTLIEILIVVATLTILIGAATPAMMGMMKASRLTSAGEILLSQLTEAQFTAISEFTDVEVRLYELPDFSRADSELKMRGIQFHVLRAQPSGDSTQETFQAAMPIVRLGDSVAISKSETFSSLMSLKFKNDTENTTGPGGASLKYIAFRFRSDGSTDLFPGIPWFITLSEANATSDGETAPANYFTIQIDPETGKLRTFRP